MVDEQLRGRGIRDERVLRAMLEIPREEFVPQGLRHQTYGDEPLRIGHGQTISQPYITARMAELLELGGGERVLDIGTGSGYHAALLGALAREVISIERIPELTAIAMENLRRAGLDQNITVICGDGSLGAPDHSLFDAISVAAAAPRIPPALLAQLADPGILVIPTGTRADQELRVVRKKQGRIEERGVSPCRFVPLVGSEGFKETE
jgi:protein-L-isoaspartate(D-aspartate) O-methyltransferase